MPFSLRRRAFFHAGGLGALALADLLRAGAQPARPHFRPRARRAINICLVGGLSQVDSFDYKPTLERLHGQVPPLAERPDVFFGQVGRLRKNEWRFHRRGQSGQYVSELFPHLAKLADRLSFIHSMVSDTGNHTPALFLAQSGFPTNGFPAMGSWISYGLGQLTNDLPSFVVLPDARGAPSGGASSWSSAFLPADHQGVELHPGPEPVRDLFPASPRPPGVDREIRDFLGLVDRKQIARLGGTDRVLEARLESYELAARLQLSVPEACNLEREPLSLREAYGLERKETRDFARSCLTARRLLERGVRFVQLYSGGPLGGAPRTSWDGHEDNRSNHAREALRIDRPVAALLRDLEQRGLLEDTVVTCTTEFGRTPFTQSAPDKLGLGRDHNHAGFTVWMAGAGLRPGVAYGKTDEIGYRAVENPVSWHDFHATLLHLLGLDHEELTFYHNGIERRLTNVHGEVLHELLS